MEIRILNKDPLLDYRQFCKITLGETLKVNDLELKYPVKFWVKHFCAMHSTVRAIHFRIIDEIPRSCAMQLVRHTDGHPQPEVQSSRPDWTGKPRSNDPYELKLIAFDFTPESWLKMCRKRLCNKTEVNTRKVVEGWREKMLESKDPIILALGLCSKPVCEYCGGVCTELKTCGKYKNYMWEKYIL